MALELTPLETLPPAVERVVGATAPAPLRLMAARGLSPLGPVDLITALYQLSYAEDEAIKSAALKSAAELPEKILGGALESDAVDARVVDFFARRSWQKPMLLERVLLNKQTHDLTFCHLATLCGESTLEMIAKNEQRLLRCPEIITALYMNPKTRMSTAQRALELAVRNGITVDGIPAFEEAAREIRESGAVTKTAADAMDAAFAHAAEVAVDAGGPLVLTPLDPDEAAALEAAAVERAEAEASGEVPPAEAALAEEKRGRLEDLPAAAKIRLATLGNAFARSVLIRDKNRQVAMACIKSPAVGETEVLKYASNRSLDDEIIGYISHRRQWVRLYSIKLALCNNPKCPLPTSMRLLPHLNARDLKMMARSKGIPSALALAAKQMVQQRNA